MNEWQSRLWKIGEDKGDFVRISKLPVLEPPYNAGQEQWIDDLHLEDGSMKLTPIQRAALSSLRRLDTVVGSMGVGTGKTAIAGLAPKALKVPGNRCLYLVPPSLVKTAQAEFDKYQDHFDIDPPIILSYSKLSNKNASKLLEEINPAAIIADEAHYLRNSTAARTKRVFRFLNAKENWGVRFIPLSGTLIQKSVKDAWHLFKRALWFRSPLPVKWPAMDVLALCSDVEEYRHDGRYATFEDKQKIAPMVGTSNATREQVRNAIQDCIRTCDGVVQTTEASARQSIYRYTPKGFRHPQHHHELIAELNETWCTPDGQPLREAIHLWAATLQLSVGFYYKMQWGPEGPNIPWLNARCDYNSQLRSFLKYRGGHHGLDTPASVEDHLKTGSFPLDPNLLRAYQVWKNIEPTADPTSSPVWLDRSLLEHAKKLTEQKKGILWFDYICVGDELRKMGMEVYQAGAEIPSHIKRPIAASIKAHGTGKNLQTWDTNIVLTPPSSAATWEQLIGRTHRLGQNAQQIDIFIYQTTEAQKDCVNKALTGARYLRNTTGQEQKLLLSSKVA